MTDLEAGRELDELIGREVFGGPEEYPNWRWWSGSNPAIDIPALWCGPAFSTDIAAAWLMVEKLGLFVGPSIRGDWVAWSDLMSNETMAFAETMPLAVCRLASKIRKGLPEMNQQPLPNDTWRVSTDRSPAW